MTVQDMMTNLARYEACIVESLDLASNPVRAKANCSAQLNDTLVLLYEGSRADVRAQVLGAVDAYLDDHEIVAETVYRLSVDLPTVPTDGATVANHVPTGWQTTKPAPTATESVFSVSRNSASRNGTFVAATAWNHLTLVVPNQPVITTVVEKIYKLSRTTPVAPRGRATRFWWTTTGRRCPPRRAVTRSGGTAVRIRFPRPNGPHQAFATRFRPGVSCAAMHHS